MSKSHVKKIIGPFLILIFVLGFAISTVAAQSLKERDAEAKNRYNQAKDQYQKEVNFYKNAREDYLNARTKFQQFRNAENKEALEDAARTFLEKAVSSLIKRLETVKTWVSNKKTLSEDKKKEIIVLLDSDINWLNQTLTKIKNATPEQIKEEAKAVSDYWKKHRGEMKGIVGEIWSARVDYVITKAESFSAKAQDKINQLKETGKDTSELEVWLSDFNQKINLAKKKNEAARAKFKAISSLADFDQLFKQGHQFIKEADKYIREAHSQLVKIVQELKKTNTE